MTPPARILLIRPSALGDVCRTVPLAASLRAAWPEAQLDWLVQRGFEEAVAHHPAVSNVIGFPRREIALGRLWRTSARRTLTELLKALREARYDLVIDAQGLARSGFFAWATRAKRRVGFGDARELGWAGLTQRVRAPRNAHTVDRMLALIEALGVPALHDLRLYTGETDRQVIQARLGPVRSAVLAPTSRWPGKRWPAMRFAELAEQLLEQVDRIVLVGARAERDQCAQLIEHFASDERVLDLIGKTTVGELMAVIERSAIVIANDSAALHMAVGFDRPLVGLFGPTQIERVGPYGRAHDVIQATPPAPGISHKHDQRGAHAMGQISVAVVVEAVLQRLDRPSVQSTLESERATATQPTSAQQR